MEEEEKPYSNYFQWLNEVSDTFPWFFFNTPRVTYYTVLALILSAVAVFGQMRIGVHDTNDAILNYISSNVVFSVALFIFWFVLIFVISSFLFYLFLSKGNRLLKLLLDFIRILLLGLLIPTLIIGYQVSPELNIPPLLQLINNKGVLFAILFHLFFIFIILIDLIKSGSFNKNNLKSDDSLISSEENKTSKLIQNAPEIYNQFGQPYMHSSLSSKELIKEASPEADIENDDKSFEDKELISASWNNPLLALITLLTIIYLKWDVIADFGALKVEEFHSLFSLTEIWDIIKDLIRLIIVSLLKIFGFIFFRIIPIYIIFFPLLYLPYSLCFHSKSTYRTYLISLIFTILVTMVSLVFIFGLSLAILFEPYSIFTTKAVFLVLCSQLYVLFVYLIVVKYRLRTINLT